MSTTTGADHAPHDQYVDYDEFVDFQIEKARNHIKATDIFTTLTTLAAAFVGYLFLFVVFDQWVFAGGFSDWARLSLLGVLLATMGAILVRRVVLPLIRRVHPLYAARMLEKSDPKLQSNLLNFVDLQHADGMSSSPQVVRAMQKRAALELSHIDVDEAIDRRPLLRTAYALLAIVVVSALYIVLSPKDPFPSVKRAFLSSVAVATETTISEVTPGDDKVPARTLLTIEADVRGKDADNVRILFTTADHKYVDEAVEMHRIDPDLPRFRGTLNGENGRGLLQSLHYAIAAGDARTREFQVEVVQPPAARVEDVHYSFPSYMQLEEQTTPGGNIDGWEGASVTVRATANMPVKSAMIVLTDSEDPHAKGEEIAMDVVDGTKLTARWKLGFRTDGTFARFYHVQLRTARNETDPDPALHTVRIRPDQRPEVELVFPRGDLVDEHAKPANAIIPLVIQASDPDFQLRSIRLMAESNGEELRIPPLFDGRDLGQSFRGNYDWDLSKHNLRPGQKVQFWIEARDNKQPTANRGVTPRLALEIRPEKSPQEIQQELVAEKKDQEDQLARADDTRNQEGSEELPGKDPGDEKGDTPSDDKEPEDRANRPDPATPPEPADKEPEKGRGKQPEDRNTTDAEENRGERQPKPSGDQNERALEKLLQKQAEEEQKKNQDKQTKPSDAEDKNQSGSDTKPSGKPGQKRDNREKPSAGDEGDKNTSETEKGPDGKPSGKPGDSPRPEGSPEKKNDQSKGGEKKPNKSGKPGEPTEPNPGKDPEKSSDPTQGGKSPDDKKPQDAKSGNSKNPDPKKQPGEKSGSEQKNPPKDPMSEGDKPKKTGPENASNENGEKGTGGRDKPEEKTGTPEDKGEPGKEEPGKEGPDKEGENKKPDKNASDKNATDKTDDSNDDKNKEPGDRGDDTPPSDGKGDDENAASEKSGNQSGTPSKSKSKGAETEGDASGGDPTKPDPKGSDKKSNSDPAEGGEEEPAEDSPDAKKRKATGDETGEATGSQEDDPDAVKAKNDLQRKPGSEPGKTKPSDKTSKKPSEKTGTPSGDKRNPQPGTSSSTDDPRDTKRAPDGKSPKEPMPRTDDPATRKTEPNKSNDRARQPGDPPDAGNQPKEPGKSPPQPKQPSTGQEGRSAASDKGKSGANKEGAGDKSPMSGDDVQSSDPTGKPGNKSGEGSTAKSRQTADNSTPKPGEGDSSDESSKSGKDGGTSGKPGGKSASKPGKGGQPGGDPDGQRANSSEGSGVTGTPSSSGTSDEGDGSGSDGSDPTGDHPRNSDGTGASPDQDEEANLENAKKASNLLLKRLQKQLERGEVDQKLLDEMGWKDLDDVKNFTRYLESNLENTGEDNSAEAVARRLQFEEMLKSMRLGNETERRLGGNTPQRRVLPTSVRNVPLPAEYREIQEAYSKSLSKQGSKGTPAKTESGKPASPTKAPPKK